MTHEEEMALRELAAKPHYIAKVQDVLGPLSLWSSQGLQDHVRKAVEAEREACAKVCDQADHLGIAAHHCAVAIRARGQQ